MPKQLNTGRVTQALQRAFGFKGRYIPMLDEVIVPVYVIADPSPAELTRIAAGTVVAITPVSAEFPVVQLLNPAGSGVIANLTTAVCSSDVKVELNVSFFDTPLTDVSATPPRFRDRRIGGSPACQLRFDATTLSPNLTGIVAVLQVDGALSQTAAWIATTSDPRQPLTVLGPGQGVVVQFATAAGGTPEQVRTNFRWLEIPIDQIAPIGGIP